MALIDEFVSLTDIILMELGMKFDEARGAYYYEEVLKKRSLTGDSNSGPCDDCDDNEEAGWIDSEALYPSGHDGPPFHPHCVCEEEYRQSRQRTYV